MKIENSKSKPPTPQYNHLQSAYDVLRLKSIALIEKENVQTIVSLLISDARVLELACGSGFYSYDLERWGAQSVLAVDISDIMIQAAKEKATNDCSTGVRFMLADGSQPRIYPGAPFDLIFAAWLLDNAPDRETLVSMFRNVSSNLKAGGHFVTVTAAPTSDPVAFIEEKNRLFPGPEGAGGVVYKILGEVPDGLHILVHGPTDLGHVDIDCYYLRQEVIESAAREGGMSGRLEWAVTEVPDHYLRGEGPGDASSQELQNYALVPQYGVLTILKS